MKGGPPEVKRVSKLCHHTVRKRKAKRAQGCDSCLLGDRWRSHRGGLHQRIIGVDLAIGLGDRALA